MRPARPQSILEELHVGAVNPGACSGPGNWVSDPGGDALVSRDPTTGQEIATVIQATQSSYHAIASQAVDSFQAWRQVPAPKRGMVVRDLGSALREIQEPLAELVTLEMGKIKAEALGEVQEMIDICDFAVGLSRQLYGLTMQSERPGHRMYEQWLPLGPIGIITAFNFPTAVWSWNAAIAAICGDTMIWKPSSLAPLAAVATQHVANRVMGDHDLSGIFNLAIGSGKEIGEQMIRDARLPLISFTGSVNRGRHVAEVVARRLGRTLLELGGNNGIVVEPDANLDLAVRAILYGAVGTAGQRCTTTRRIIVHRDVVDELTRRLVHAYHQIPIGDPMQEGTLMGPLINQEAVDNMIKALEIARSQGGEIVTGGSRLPDKGPYFVEPAIVRWPRQPVKSLSSSIACESIVCEETFAPILHVLEYETLQEALALHNAVPQGLSSAIFTVNLLQAQRFLSAAGSDCGIANVNIGTSGAEIGGAFGGEKETGGGREAGSDAWKAYMRRQTVTINWSDELPLAQGIQFG